MWAERQHSQQHTTPHSAPSKKCSALSKNFRRWPKWKRMCVPLSFVHMPVHTDAQLPFTDAQLPFLCFYGLVFLVLSLLLFISCLIFLSLVFLCLVFLCLVFVFLSGLLTFYLVFCLSIWSFVFLSGLLTFYLVFWLSRLVSTVFYLLSLSFHRLSLSFSVHLSRACACKQEHLRASTIIFRWHTLSRTNFFHENIFKFLTQVAHTTLSNTFHSTLYVSLFLLIRGCFFLFLFLSFSTNEVVWLGALHPSLIRCIISFSVTHARTHTLQKI